MGIWKFLWNILTGKSSEAIPGNSDYDDQSDTAQYASSLTGITPPPKDEVPVTGDDRSIWDVAKDSGHGFLDTSFGDFIKSLGQLVPALVNRISANQLTGAEREANAFSAEQAQIDRAFQERMANTQYQRGVADMRAAGVNPALAIGQGGAAAPSGQAAPSVNPQGSAFNLGEIFQLMMIKPEMELMRKQGDAALMQGQAALKNAGTNAVNAETGQGRLDVERYDAETRRMLANNQIRIGDSTITLNESKVAEIAQAIKESESRIELQDIEKLAKNLDYEFNREMYDTNKALLIQQLAYRAVEMSNLRQLTAESAKRIELMSNEQAGSQWMSDHPKLAAGIGIASGITGVIGNVLKGSVSGVIGRWSKQ